MNTKKFNDCVEKLDIECHGVGLTGQSTTSTPWKFDSVIR